MDTDESVSIDTLQARPGGSFALAALTAELRGLVDQLEMDWRNDRMIRRETVEDLHDLRARADQLLETVG
jgi:hypothetical protein